MNQKIIAQFLMQFGFNCTFLLTIYGLKWIKADYIPSNIFRAYVFQGFDCVAFYKANANKQAKQGAKSMPKVKVALIGVGNCASLFIQGIQYYGKLRNQKTVLDYATQH